MRPAFLSRRFLARSLVLFAASYAPIASAQTAPLRNTYGEVGMLDMANAHMAPDGELAFVIGDIEKTNHFSINFQAMPWLETSFRYSHIAPGSQNYDRSFGFKMRLLTEENGLADVSVGVRDLLGTGIYSSEYVAASKHIGAVDLTAGLGWGRLADSNTLPNPFGLIFSSFKVRGAQSSANTGGAFNLKEYFRGPKVGLFGGAVWQTPIEGLSLIAEYSGDKYTREKLEAPLTFPVRSPLNLGVAYRLANSVSVSAGWYYGSSYGFTISLSGNPTEDVKSAGRIGPSIPDAIERTPAQQRLALNLLLERNSSSAMWKPANERERSQLTLSQALLSQGRGVRDMDLRNATLMVDAHIGTSAIAQCANYARIAAQTKVSVTDIAVSDLEDGDGQVTFCPIAAAAPRAKAVTERTDFEKELRDAMLRQNLVLNALTYGVSEVSVYYENNHYNNEGEALGRVIRLLMRYADPSAELFYVYPMVFGQPAERITITRSSMERLVENSASSSELGHAVSIDAAPLNNPALSRASHSSYPRFYWWLGPRIGEQLFDPDKPFQLMLMAQGDAAVSLAPGLNIATSLTSTVWSNYIFTRPAGSLLPHVRTDLLKYLDKGATGISYLGVDYTTRIAPEVFAEARAGYLEDMFMGVGGQILWRPKASRFAVGADAYQVWQRNFDRLFGAQGYNVLTGHVSVYYNSPWYNLNFAVHAGHYLAGDYGATFEISRRFASGVEVGVFATFTNVPFSKFGEGSFDKGISLRIPLEWGLPIYSQTGYNLDLRSLTRDGGQRLANDDSLYAATLRTSYGEILSHSDDLIRP